MKRLLLFIVLILSLGMLLVSCAGDGDNGDNTDTSDGEKPDSDPDVNKEWEPNATVLPVKGGAKGIVVLIHDDGIWDTAVTLDKLYHSYGLVGDVAMLSSKLYNTQTGTENASALANWRALVDTGRWNMVSHSHTHTWWGTATQNSDGSYTFVEDDQKLYDEIIGSQRILRELFPGQRVLTFAYPGFTTEKGYVGKTAEKIFEIIYSERARKMLEETYISSRASLGLNIDVDDPDKRWENKYGDSVYSTESVWDYFPAYSLGDSNVESRKLLYVITNCAAGEQMAVIYMHKVVDELTGGSNEMTTASMNTLCQHLAKYTESGKIWNAHYDDAVLYVREANAATVTITGDETALTVTLTDTLDNEIYNYPLTVRVGVPESWAAVKLTQGDSSSYAVAKQIDGEWFVDFDIVPDSGAAALTPISPSEVPPAEIVEVKPPVSATNPVPEAPAT